MNSVIREKFLNVIRRQKEAYKKLIPVISEETKFLKENNVKAIDSLLPRQERILEEIKNLETEKNAVYRELIKSEGLPEISIWEYVEKYNSKINPEIEKELSELVECVKIIDNANKGNAVMIRNFLTLSEFTEQLKNRMENPVNVTYNQNAGKDEFKVNDEKKGLDIKL